MKGLVSIFQLLGRYIRRISMVFQPDLTTRDKQHYGTLTTYIGTCILFTLLLFDLGYRMHARILGKTLKVNNILCLI